MYHRFDENKYPSTNIRMEVFKEHLEEIKNLNLEFISFQIFEKIVYNKIDKNYLLLTIDDAFSSFYLNAWPIIKKNKIPIILFVSTREVGKYGYMTWDQIREIAASDLVTIGNHSHSHEYLIDWDEKKIREDLEIAIKIFNKELGYSPNLFSYPFGEYSNILKKIVADLNFKFAFGQHSGVIDLYKSFLELPRFPINEKYGELKRFKSIINYIPFYYKKIYPEENYLTDENNPPDVFVEFFPEQNNIKNITCYSNENNKWRQSKIDFENNYKLKILIEEKFTTERGRINCSLNDIEGWRWFGIQFVIKEN